MSSHRHHSTAWHLLWSYRRCEWHDGQLQVNYLLVVAYNSSPISCLLYRIPSLLSPVSWLSLILRPHLPHTPPGRLPPSRHRQESHGNVLISLTLRWHSALYLMCLQCLRSAVSTVCSIYSLQCLQSAVSTVCSVFSVLWCFDCHINNFHLSSLLYQMFPEKTVIFNFEHSSVVSLEEKCEAQITNWTDTSCG